MNIVSKQKSFTQQIVDREGGEVRYITGKEQGKSCWYFVRINPQSYIEYKKSLPLPGIMDLNDYGEILESGWGEEAPDSIMQIMKEKYDVIS